MPGKFNPEEYEPVEERLDRFWTEHPAGRIETRLLTPTDSLDEIVFWAGVWFDAGEEHPRGVGHASERRGGQGANQASHLENGETSAIGRALANCGYKARKDAPRPSREEMRKATALPESRGDHAAVGKGEREGLIAEMQERFTRLHPETKFYPWASEVLGHAAKHPLELAEMQAVVRHLRVEEAVQEGQARQGGAPPAQVQGA
jgi:hypothetical protein